MSNSNNVKKSRMVAIGLVILYILLLIPVLYIGRYDYHCADDFGFSAASHVAWEDTHSLIAVFKAAGETVVDRWHTWQGTFTTMFLMALEPGLFGEVFYHFVPWIMIGAMSASTMYLLYVLLVKLVSCDKPVWISVSMLYLIYALECIIDPLQGFFWYNGAVHYMIPHSLAMLLVAILIKARISEKKIILCFLACVIAFLLGGSNFITALGTGVGLVFAIIISVFFRHRKNIWLLIMPTIIYVPALLLNVFAPGNSVRQSGFANHPGPIKAVMLAFYYCIEEAFSNWLDWKVFMLMLALLPFSILIVKKIRNRYSFGFCLPLMVVVVLFCFLSSLFAPTSYATGGVGGGRVENIIYLDFLLLSIFLEIYIIGWLDVKFKLIDTINQDNSSRVNKCMFWGSVIVIVVFFAGLTFLREEDSFTTTSAIASIASGEARRYGNETKERSEMIDNCDGDLLEVPRFVETPYLLYMDDIVPNSNDWRNNSMARYYGFDEVVAYSID